jgi:TonB-dependent receptor
MKSLKQRLALKPLAVAVTLMAASNVQADGIVKGRLIDALGKTTYTDAVVRVEELNREVLTGASGRFRLPSLPAGNYTLSVIIGGEQVKQHPVVVNDNDTTLTSILLNDETHELEEVLVIGQAAQVQRALDRQRFADNTISVINADAIGQLPDSNAAEALQRVPGLSIERDQGEGRFVRVRGISPDLNAVTVNGTQLPAPEGGRRAVALDVMPADLISALVVTKTLTPDMDANAIGGSIEVESLSALDREGAFYTLRAEAKYDQLTDQTSPAYGLSAGNTIEFSDGARLGIASALSYDQRKFGSDNVETGGAWDDGQLEELEQRDYSIERERIGAALNFDLEVDAANRFYLRNLYSSYKDDEQRLANVVKFGEEVFDADENENVFEETARAPGDTGLAEVARELKDREETQTIFSTTFGAEHFIDQWTLEYALGYSKAKEDEPGGISGAVFETELDGMGFRNSRKPALIATDAYYDGSEFELDKIEYEEALTEDTQTSARFDLTRDLFINDQPSQIRFGAKISEREKVSAIDSYEFEDFSDYGYSDAQLTLDNFISANTDWQLGNFGPQISAAKVRDVINTLKANTGKSEFLNAEDSGIEDYIVEETITAAYLMANMDMDDLFVLAGVRYEATEHDFDGSKYDQEAEQFSDYQDDNRYSHVLPNIQARYQLADDTQLRAAWTNSVVRPTFEQMAPALNDENGEAESGNPQLDAMTSSNLDLGIEHYSGSAAALSASLFYKEIDDFIYQADIAGQPGFTEYDEVESYDNGDSANLKGIEFAASQKLHQLPAPFDGLLLSANLTLSESEAQLSYDGGKRTINLPSHSETTGNLVIGYEKNGLMLRLAANYKSDYLLEVSDVEDKSGDIYQDAQTQLDFSAAYAITEQLKVNLAISNLTDEPYYTYQNKEKYNAQFEDYGPTYRLGISFNSF